MLPRIAIVWECPEVDESVYIVCRTEQIKQTLAFCYQHI